MTTDNDAPASPHHPRKPEGNRGMDPRHKYAIIDPDTGKIDRRIFSDQAIYDEEMEKIFGARLADDRAREPGARGRRLLPHVHGRGPGDPHPRRPGPAARAAEHVPAPRQSRGALRRRQRPALHVHLSRLDLRQRRHARARRRGVRGLLRRARQAVARPRRGPGRHVRRDRVRHLGRGCAEPRGLSRATRAGTSTRSSTGATAGCRRSAR